MINLRSVSRSCLPVVLAWWMLSSSALACPFCSAVSQTMRQEMAQMDAAVLATIVPESVTDAFAEFEVREVLKGEEFIQPGHKITVNFFGTAKPDQSFLIMGVDPEELLWSTPLALTEAAVDYVQTIKTLPVDDPITRLKFYMQFLESPDKVLSRDAYDEFASTPYEDIKKLSPAMDRGQLLSWVQDTSLPADRKRLYFVMLGVCGQPEDAKLLEKMMRSEDPEERAGLDSLIACFITLTKGDELQVVDELFLANKQSQYSDTYNAIMALRFHGTEGGIVEKERILKSMRLILERPELADLVIPDLARWEDWTQIDRLVELFKNAEEGSSWVRVPVINYLRSCPLPAAEEQLNVLKEIDPAAFKRAVSYFPVPKSQPDAVDSSRVTPAAEGDAALPGVPAADRPTFASASPTTDAGWQVALADELVSTSSLRNSFASGPRSANSGMQLAAATPLAAVVRGSELRGESSPQRSANRLAVTGVVLLAGASLGLAMWLSLDGAGTSVIPRRSVQA